MKCNKIVVIYKCTIVLPTDKFQATITAGKSLLLQCVQLTLTAGQSLLLQCVQLTLTAGRSLLLQCVQMTFTAGQSLLLQCVQLTVTAGQSLLLQCVQLTLTAGQSLLLLCVSIKLPFIYVPLYGFCFPSSHTLAMIHNLRQVDYVNAYSAVVSLPISVRPSVFMSDTTK